MKKQVKFLPSLFLISLSLCVGSAAALPSGIASTTTEKEASVPFRLYEPKWRATSPTFEFSFRPLRITYKTSYTLLAIYLPDFYLTSNPATDALLPVINIAKAKRQGTPIYLSSRNRNDAALFPMTIGTKAASLKEVVLPFDSHTYSHEESSYHESWSHRLTAARPTVPDANRWCCTTSFMHTTGQV